MNKLSKFALASIFTTLSAVASAGPLEDGQLINDHVSLQELGAYLVTIQKGVAEAKDAKEVIDCTLSGIEVSESPSGVESLKVSSRKIAVSTSVEVIGPGRLVHKKLRNGTFAQQLTFTEVAAMNLIPANQIDIVFDGKTGLVHQVKFTIRNASTGETISEQKCTRFWSGNKVD
jgi:hypothetical protein